MDFQGFLRDMSAFIGGIFFGLQELLNDLIDDTLNYDSWFIVCIAYLLIINVIAFALFGADKKKAINKEWRISEKTLILSALVGGSLGAYMGMYGFHHKTRKLLFSVGVPCILFFQVFLLSWFALR